MQFANPFEHPGNWYKGNLHIHSTNSDGKLSPEELCRIYDRAGYDFLCITDHNKITTGFESPQNLLLMSGCEITTPEIHIVGLGMKEAFDPEGMSGQKIIERINRQHAIPVIAHPYWSGLTSKQLLEFKGYAGIELYNSVCDNTRGKGYSTVHFDEVLQEGMKIAGFANDDTHSEADLGKSFIMVKAPSLNETDILDAIKKGLFYSSTGVIIRDLKSGNGKIEISVTGGARHIDFMGLKFTGRRISGTAGELYNAEYDIKGTEQYLRIEITDARGRKAWTNPGYPETGH